MTSAPRWSIKRRLTRWFTLTTTGLVLAVSATSLWFLRRATERELGALLLEEHDEMRMLFLASARDRESFERIANELSGEHPANPIAWRVWLDERVLWGEFGDLDLLEPDTPVPWPLERNLRLERGRRWRVERFETGHAVAVVVDGSSQLAFERGVWISVGVLVVLSPIVAFAMGWLFCEHVARLLRQVADEARSVRDPTDAVELEVPGAPDEIRAVADALRETLMRVRAESEHMRLMAAGLAHELRSPIQNLVGETEVVLLAERGAAQYRGVLESHLEELHDLGNAVDNLVTLFSASGAADSKKREHFDLGREARLRLQRELGLAVRRGVAFDITTEGDLSMHGDREALLRAVRNLADNAIHWTPPGGRVSVGLDGTGRDLLVTVDDSGPGVPVEERERIFDAFYRGRAAKGRRMGYGLGLALTKSAVDGHGGEIEVGDRPGGGARFRARLFRERRNGARAALQEAPAASEVPAGGAARPVERVAQVVRAWLGKGGA